MQIDTVYAGTPAWRAGLKCDDLITAVNGKPVKTAQELTALLARMEPGTTVTLTDHPASGGRTKQVKVQVSQPARERTAQRFHRPRPTWA